MTIKVCIMIMLVTSFVTGGNLWAEKKPVVLTELVKPAMMVTNDGKLYVLQKTTIFIYSLKDFKLIKKFGRNGEGPGEFMARPFGPPMTMSFSGGKLMVNSNNKLTYFTPNGNYLTEVRAPANTVYYQYLDQLIAIGPMPNEKKQFNIAFRINSSEFNQTKMLYHGDVSVQFVQSLILPLSAFTYNPVAGDKIVINTDPEEFIISIFDKSGNVVRTIKKDEKKIPITSAYKTDTLNFFKNDPMFRTMYEQIKPAITFRSDYPAIRDLNVGDGNITVITFKQKDGLWECIRMDMTGKELGRTFVPLSDYIPYTYYAMLYSVEDGIFYTLIEDEEEETWNLHTKKLN